MSFVRLTEDDLTLLDEQLMLLTNHFVVNGG